MLTAYRVWKILEDDQSNLRLTSLVFSEVIWPLDSPMVAECHSRAEYGERGESPAPSHFAPHHKCDCGIYSVLNPADMWGSMMPAKVRSGSWVIGKVGIWGQVFPHERGYRSEFAKILELYPLIFQEVVYKLSSSYTIPLSDYREEQWGELLKSRL